MPTRFELDPGEVERFLKPMEPRAQLVFRICINGVSSRCRTNRVFRDRLDRLIVQFSDDLAAITAEAATLTRDLGQAR
jgi:hypothetical protein